MTISKNDKKYLEVALEYLYDDKAESEYKMNDLVNNYDFDNYPQVERLYKVEEDNLSLLKESIKLLERMVKEVDNES